MTIQEKYDMFVEEYWKDIADLKEGAKSKTENFIADLFTKLGAPLTKKEWLDKELQEVTDNEDYEYCNQLKQELLNV